MSAGRVATEDPAERRLRNAGFDPTRIDPAGLAAALVDSPVLDDPMALAELDGWACERRLSSARLKAAGWRGIRAKDWQHLAHLAAAHGWPPRIDGRGHEHPAWPARIDRGAALLIPYRNADGKIGSGRFRRLEGKGAKVLSLHGDTSARLYGAEQLPMASPGAVIHIAEGESDAESLRECGAIAIGVPGSSIWRPEWAAAIADAQPRCAVTWLDGDEAGRKGTERIVASLRIHGIEDVRNWRPPEGQDVNDVLRSPDGRAELAKLISEAES